MAKGPYVNRYLIHSSTLYTFLLFGRHGLQRIRNAAAGARSGNQPEGLEIGFLLKNLG